MVVPSGGVGPGEHRWGQCGVPGLCAELQHPPTTINVSWSLLPHAHIVYNHPIVTLWCTDQIKSMTVKEGLMIYIKLISEAAPLHDGRQPRPEPNNLKGQCFTLLSCAHMLLKSKG